MVTVVTIRPGVQFTPEAAKAFERAEKRVNEVYGRNIRVSSTYRDWDTQLAMYNAWQDYINGRGPYPGHSKAVHPSESFHTKGTALDSPDYTVSGIVNILAENGFIRNRLNVPNEQHHFEYLRNSDKHYGEPIEQMEEDSMFINIKGKQGKRRGGLYYVSGGEATFIGGRKKSAFPKFTNEEEIAILQKVIKGLK